MKLVKGDIVKGVVVRTTNRGVCISIDDVDGECFARCNLCEGDVAWFMLESFVINAYCTQLNFSLESVVYYNEAA